MSIIKEIKNFLKSSVNFISFIIALIPSIMLWIFKPESSVDAWIFVITLYFCFILLWLLIIVMLNLKPVSNSYTLSLITIASNMLLCESNHLVTYDSIVSIYLKENGFENLVGYGIILNIQDDGLIQIEPHILPDTVISHISSEFVEILLEKKHTILIKPTVTQKIINALNSKEVNSNVESF
ncbi:hypothetical protein [Clostridium cadaveris]|uniref:hypothetical protein n=1 Tax=Clostridium cadaveris TaxID=1529 RepID=UPI000C07D6BC|nr:hypothetical protein [Clostridium cadaveris]